MNIKYLNLIVICLLILIGCSDVKIDTLKSIDINTKLYETSEANIVDGHFDGYYNLKNIDREYIPLLLHLTFDYKEKRSKYLSDSIDNMEVSIEGMNTDVDIYKTAAEEDSYILFILLKTKSENIITPLENESELVYLKEKFPDRINIKSIDENIEYTVEGNTYKYFSYTLAIRLVKSKDTNKLEVYVDDEGSVILKK